MSLVSDIAPAHEAKKVAICGFAESWKLAPFDDPTVEIWGLNELHKYLPRWDRWWEVHDADTLGVTKRDLSEGEQKRHLEWLAKDHGPNKRIYMQPEFCDGRFPNAVTYPLDKMCRIFGRYFTSSIGYMLADAIVDGYSWIGLFGIDLASDVEYPYQRPNSEYLIGMARGLGREVVLAPTSAICKAGHLYGYEKPLTERSKVLDAVRGHHAGLKKKHEELLATMHTLDGAMQECENFYKLHEYLERGVTLTNY
jgi:hypothetical protein